MSARRRRVSKVLVDFGGFEVEGRVFEILSTPRKDRDKGYRIRVYVPKDVAERVLRGEAKLFLLVVDSTKVRKSIEQ